MADKDRIKRIMALAASGRAPQAVAEAIREIKTRKAAAQVAAVNVVKEAVLADRYSGKNYTFDEAYKDARSKGQKTFFWNGKYYNTDYEGEHGKKYREDVRSGKAAAFQEAYPGYTNPELRKEKQEELDTYGITDEQTRNKSARDRALRRIPARGYDVNDAISGMIGEHNSYSQYDSVEDLVSALRKKYPDFKDIPLEGGYVDDLSGGKSIYLKDIRDVKKPEGADDDLWTAFKNDVDKYDRFNALGGNPVEIHRTEYDYLLGYPISGQGQDYEFSNTPIISRYRTGSDPYYYTTPLVNLSSPFVPKSILDIRDKRQDQRAVLDDLEETLIHPNVDKLPEGHTYEEYVEADKKDMALPQNRRRQRIIDARYAELFGPFDDFSDKYYSDTTYRKKWNNVGVSMYRGGLNIDYPLFFRRASDADKDTLGRIGAFDYLTPLELTPGNRLASSGYDSYYRHDDDLDSFRGKYSKLISRINPSKEDHNKYGRESLNTSQFIHSEPSLGVYTLGVPKDTSYVSVWDIFNVDPFGSGNDKPIIQIGKPFEYYTRFYPEGREPDIDALYNGFGCGGKKFDGGGDKGQVRDNTRVSSVVPSDIGYVPAMERPLPVSLGNARWDDGVMGVLPFVGDALQGVQAAREFANRDPVSGLQTAGLLLVPNIAEKSLRGFFRKATALDVPHVSLPDNYTVVPGGIRISNADFAAYPGLSREEVIARIRDEVDDAKRVTSGRTPLHGVLTPEELGEAKEIPKAVSVELTRSTMPRMLKMREGLSPEEILEFKKKFHDVIGGNYTEFPKVTRDKAGIAETTNGQHFRGNDFLWVAKEESADTKNKVIGHELRHRIDKYLPLADEEKKILDEAYPESFETAYPDKFPRWTADDMKREKVTTNRDARKVLFDALGDGDHSTADIQNWIIDQATPLDIANAVYNSNGYGREFIRKLMKDNDGAGYTVEAMEKIREAMKRVGAVAGAGYLGKSLYDMSGEQEAPQGFGVLRPEEYAYGGNLFGGGGPGKITVPNPEMIRNSVRGMIPASVLRTISHYGTRTYDKDNLQYINLNYDGSIGDMLKDLGKEDDWDAGETFLYDPLRQRLALEKKGYHYVDDGDYGLVSSAVDRLSNVLGGKKIPIYQIGEDEISRDRLTPIPGNQDELKYLGYRDEVLKHAGSYPTALYLDKDTGDYYIRSWDLNDYGQHDGKKHGEGNYHKASEYGARQILADIYDYIGNPFVQRSGLKKIPKEWVSGLKSIPIIPETEPDSFYLGELEPSVVNANKMSCGGHLFDGGGKFFYTNPEPAQGESDLDLMNLYSNIASGLSIPAVSVPAEQPVGVDTVSVQPQYVPTMLLNYASAPIVAVPEERVEEAVVPNLFSDEAKAYRRLKQMYAESKFNKKAVSGAGARGLFQIMPITEKDYITRGKGKAGDVFDPVYNEAIRDYVFSSIPKSMGGVWSDDWSDEMKLAVLYGAYNWGAGNMRNYLRKLKSSGKDISDPRSWVDGLNKETRNYIKFLALDEDVPGTGMTRAAFENAARKMGYMADGGRLFEMGGPSGPASPGAMLAKYVKDLIDKYKVAAPVAKKAIDLFSGNSGEIVHLSEFMDAFNALPEPMKKRAIEVAMRATHNPEPYNALETYLYAARDKKADPLGDIKYIITGFGSPSLNENDGLYHEVLTDGHYVLRSPDVKTKNDVIDAVVYGKPLNPSIGTQVTDGDFGILRGYKDRVYPDRNIQFVQTNPPGIGTSQEGIKSMGVIHPSAKNYFDSTFKTSDPHIDIDNAGYSMEYGNRNDSTFVRAWDIYDFASPSDDSAGYKSRWGIDRYDSQDKAVDAIQDMITPLFIRTPWVYYKDASKIVDDDTVQYGIESNINARAKGGKIRIKPENRGKFTALKKRTGHSASWFKAHGTPAQKKMAVFALNSKHWSHKRADGGYLQDYGQSYELGGVYDLSEEQVQELIRQGYEVERI